jgi:zinc and cadmium transporter
MVASLSGVLFLQRTAKDFLEAKLPYLISFSAGVFLVTAGGLALEVFELAPSFAVATGLIVVGYILAWAMHALLPETHHHHAPACDHSHGVAARKLIVGDAIHNVADGVLLVVAFTASPALGVAATVSVVIHEVLQEVAEFFVLRRAGYSTAKALGINFAVSSTIFIGVALGYFALASHELEVALLAVSAGFFLHVVLHNLLPKRSVEDTSRSFVTQIVLVAAGALAMGLVASALSEGHIHGTGVHEDHGHEGHDEHGHGEHDAHEAEVNHEARGEHHHEEMPQ